MASVDIHLSLLAPDLRHLWPYFLLQSTTGLMRNFRRVRILRSLLSTSKPGPTTLRWRLADSGLTVSVAQLPAVIPQTSHQPCIRLVHEERWPSSRRLRLRCLGGRLLGLRWFCSRLLGLPYRPRTYSSELGDGSSCLVKNAITPWSGAAPPLTLPPRARRHLARLAVVHAVVRRTLPASTASHCCCQRHHWMHCCCRWYCYKRSEGWCFHPQRLPSLWSSWIFNADWKGYHRTYNRSSCRPISHSNTHLLSVEQWLALSDEQRKVVEDAANSLGLTVPELRERLELYLNPSIQSQAWWLRKLNHTNQLRVMAQTHLRL